MYTYVFIICVDMYCYVCICSGCMGVIVGVILNVSLIVSVNTVSM